MHYYRLKTEEIATLPYFTFENQHHPLAPPGKSYVVAELERLVYRKFATLGGVSDEDPKSETQFLGEGQRLFEEDTAKLEARSPRKPPRTFTIVRKVPKSTNNFLDRPFGSWESPVYENGVLVGYWLNFQFDPSGDDDGFYDGYERFRSVH
ncbi:hypothetical protein B0H19DRAFT_1162900 [Mycena capillaripes]|nr:hypothetical protein B0H19DRAFT_1162900 [Mycena capillaripes]